MRNECSIIKDLLPLYAENMVGADTKDFVEEHLKGCDACKKAYESAKESPPAQKTADAAPLIRLRRKMKVKKIQTIALTAVFLTALFVSAFAVLSAPVYFPFSAGLVTPGAAGDTGMRLTFDEKVTDFEYTVYADPEGGAFYYCDIQAWTSLWDQWFSKGNGSLSATVPARNQPIVAVYVPNDGSENICIAKYDPDAENPIERHVDYASQTVLPRLSLGYFLILAAAALILCGTVRFLIRKKAQWCTWAERIGLYPIAYLISHSIVSGIHWASYSLPRDFSLIIFISVLLYSALLLSHTIWQLKKEIREIERYTEN